MRRLHFIPFLLLAAALPSQAEPRPWKSTDGQRSVNGEFVKRDDKSVTIRTDDKKLVDIEFAKLHPDDKKWLVSNHPLKGEEPEPDPSAVFDSLTFNDTRETALAKLTESKIVERIADDTFLVRSGMNGIFRTREKIGGLSAYLYFDWNGEGKMKELTLQTDTVAAESYKASLEPSWKELIELLNTLYGKPEVKGSLPSKESLGEGTFMPSHLWKLNGTGSILLGTARENGKYQLVVRFTQKATQPISTP